MHLAHTYTAQKSKSAYVEISERNAATARLLHEARQAQPAQPPQLRKQMRSLAKEVVSLWDHLQLRIGKTAAPRPGETHTQGVLPDTGTGWRQSA
jgi:hypothetical protein